MRGYTASTHLKTPKIISSDIEGKYTIQHHYQMIIIFINLSRNLQQCKNACSIIKPPLF